jgi:hypothetical protein
MKSWIHLAFFYPLGLDTRKEIWINFLRKAATDNNIEIKKKEINGWEVGYTDV